MSPNALDLAKIDLPAPLSGELGGRRIHVVTFADLESLLQALDPVMKDRLSADRIGIVRELLGRALRYKDTDALEVAWIYAKRLWLNSQKAIQG